MLNAKRSMVLHSKDAPELPRVPGLEALYNKKFIPRAGEMIMITGRSGSQKTGFALWYTASMNLPTLYFAGDMTPTQISYRLASMKMRMPEQAIEDQVNNGGAMRGNILDELGGLNMQFSYGGITWPGIEAEVEAYVELHDQFPEVVVVDNFMDMEGAEGEYQLQMSNMVDLKRFSEEIGCTMVVLHHASEGDGRAPHECPARSSIKNKLSEKPEMILGVALTPGSNEFRLAPLKNRRGPCDPSGNTYARIQAFPELTLFGTYATVGGISTTPQARGA